VSRPRTLDRRVVRYASSRCHGRHPGDIQDRHKKSREVRRWESLTASCRCN